MDDQLVLAPRRYARVLFNAVNLPCPTESEEVQRRVSSTCMAGNLGDFHLMAECLLRVALQRMSMRQGTWCNGRRCRGQTLVGPIVGRDAAVLVLQLRLEVGRHPLVLQHQHARAGVHVHVAHVSYVQACRLSRRTTCTLQICIDATTRREVQHVCSSAASSMRSSTATARHALRGIWYYGRDESRAEQGGNLILIHSRRCRDVASRLDVAINGFRGGELRVGSDDCRLVFVCGSGCRCGCGRGCGGRRLVRLIITAPA